MKTRISSENKTRPGEKGFTLIELIVVLAILAVVMYLTAPVVFSRSNSPDVALVSANIYFQLSMARSEAVARQRAVSFIVNVKDRTYGLSDKSVDAIPDGMDIELFVGASTIANDQSGRIIFYPDGSSTGGKISLAAGGNTEYVEVHWLNGQINRVR